MKQKTATALLSFLAVFYLAGCCQPETIGSVSNTLRPQETNNWCWAAVTQMLAEDLGLSITQCALANHSFDKRNCCTVENQNGLCDAERQRVVELTEKVSELEPTEGMSGSELAAAQKAAAPAKLALANAQAALARCLQRPLVCPKTSDCDIPGWVDLDFAGAKSSESATALSWADLKSQIFCAKKPMGYAYGTVGVVGHVVLIKGYKTVGGTDYVVLNDPWAPCTGQERLITYAEYSDPAGMPTHWNTWYDIAKK
jgi:hypothetical protein